MSYARLLYQDIEILRRVGSSEDARGYAGQRSIDHQPVYTVKGRVATIREGGRREGKPDMESGSLRARLYLQSDADVRTDDRVRVEGVTYHVIGPPMPIAGRRGIHHIEADLEAVKA